MELNCSNTFICELYDLPPFLMFLECIGTCLIQRNPFEYMSDYVCRFRENSLVHYKTLMYLVQHC
jgi:hypothetical protein